MITSYFDGVPPDVIYKLCVIIYSLIRGRIKLFSPGPVCHTSLVTAVTRPLASARTSAVQGAASPHSAWWRVQSTQPLCDVLPGNIPLCYFGGVR